MRSQIDRLARAPIAWLAIMAGLICADPRSLHADELQPAKDATIAAARAAAKELGEALKSQLLSAIKSGGPKSAIGVCRVIAPAIAQEVSEARTLTVKRTALKLRNPANAPDAFERKTLEDFVRRIDAGADPASLEHSAMLKENGETVFRYMKAIPTAAEPCLACHGANIAQDIKAEILKLYPDDDATGFKAGELRGAFTIVKKMP